MSIFGKADQPVWDDIARDVVHAAKAGKLADGLIAAVRRAGAVLRQHWPRGPDDRNELPDRVVEI